MSHLGWIRLEWLASMVLGAAALAACGDEDRVAPVSTGEGGGASSSSVGGTSSSSSSSSGGGERIREVFFRNPFGEQEGNLLADGGFELSVVSNPGQHGWILASGQDLTAETGGLCREGLRCARLPRNGVMFARGTSAPASSAMEVEVWLKPDGATSCEGNTLYVLSCDSFDVRRQLTQASEPDERGWCSLGGSFSGAPTATCLYLQSGADGDLLVDDVSLRAAPAVDRTGRPPVEEVVTVSARTRAEMDQLRDRLRRTLPFGRPPALPPGRERPAHWPAALVD